MLCVSGLRQRNYYCGLEILIKKYSTYLFVEDMKVYFGLLERNLLLLHIQDTCYLLSLDQQ